MSSGAGTANARRNAATACEQAVFATLSPALLVRPTGGVVEVVAGEIDGRLVLEGDIGLGPAEAMQSAIALHVLTDPRHPLLSSLPDELLEAGRSFKSEAQSYRRAWRHVIDMPERPVGDRGLSRLVEELDGWLRGAEPLSSMPFGAVITDRNRLWPARTVVYEIDSALPISKQHAVAKAIEHWRQNTFLQFEERTPSVRDYIRFVPGTTCESAAIGRVGGAQTISIAPLCSVGNIIHEIGHAIGLFHEHVRQDRDAHIRVFLKNVQRAAKPNFAIYGAEGQDAGVYDYSSIMHYDAFAFAIDPARPTILPTVSDAPAIGQRAGLSAGDRGAVARLYT
jgi:hypothetical protein